MLITVSNLFPRPDQPTRGLFNYQLFREMAKLVADRASPFTRFLNVCLVPEWRWWRWRAIRSWTCPHQALSETVYLPVFYLPVIGRSLSGWFTYRALRALWYRSGAAGRWTPVSRPASDGARDSAVHTGPVFLASWLYPDAVAVSRLAGEGGASAWLRVHGSDRFHLKSRVRRRLILDAGRAASGLLCNCRAMAEDLANRGLPSEKIHVVPNGVDGERFAYRDKETAWQGLKSVAPVGLVPTSGPPLRIVLFVGNLVPVKGPDVMVQAFAGMKDFRCRPGLCPGAPAAEGRPTTQDEEADDAHLVFIGTGPMRPELERLSHRLGVGGLVHFLGARPHEEVALWMNVADVLCLTSRSEGMPNVVLEALVSGLPVVATEAGGCRDLLAHESAAVVCPIDDVDKLASGMQALLGANADRVALAERHGSRYSWQRQAGVILKLLSKR